MHTIAITGATGVVGSRVVLHLLDRPDVARVVALGRRAPTKFHHKLQAAIVDLQDVAAVEAAIPSDASIACCCLGTTMRTAGSQQAFRAIDYDAVLTFAAAARRRGAERFLLVSSLGASARGRSFYLRTKGEAEDAVASLGYPQLTIVRPSFIDDEGRRAEHRTTERLVLPAARALFSLFGRSSRYAPITAERIARSVVRLAFDDTHERVRVVESDRLHLLGR